jgi:hypothetical protein
VAVAVAAIALGCLTGGVIVGVVQGDGREIESQTLFAIPWAALGLGLFGWPLSRAGALVCARSWLALAAPLIGALAGAIMAFPLLDMIGMCPVGRTCWRGSFLLLCRSALSSAPPPASGGGFSTAASLFAALHHKDPPPSCQLLQPRVYGQSIPTS